LILNIPLGKNVVMTGYEMNTLKSKVMPVGGFKEKTIAVRN